MVPDIIFAFNKFWKIKGDKILLIYKTARQRREGERYNGLGVSQKKVQVATTDRKFIVLSLSPLPDCLRSRN